MTAKRIGLTLSICRAFTVSVHATLGPIRQGMALGEKGDIAAAWAFPIPAHCIVFTHLEEKVDHNLERLAAGDDERCLHLLRREPHVQRLLAHLIVQPAQP